LISNSNAPAMISTCPSSQDNSWPRQPKFS